jgi:hypothetical protein
VGKTDDQLYNEHDVILIGKVIKAEGRFSERITDYTISAEKYLKNDLGEQLQLFANGKKDSNLWVEDEPIFDLGDKVLLYLIKNGNSYQISPYSHVLDQEETGESSGGGSVVIEIILSPLKQFKSGIPFDKIQCKESLFPVKKYDGSPACVKPDTATKLIQLAWVDSDEYTVHLGGGNDLDIIQEQTIFLNNGIDDYDSGTSFNPIYVKSILGKDNKITWFNAKQESVQLQSDENYFNVTVAPQEKFTFEFDTVGAHKYHDTVNWKRGTVFVSTNEIESSNLKPAKLLGKKDYEIAKTIATVALSDDIIAKKRLDDSMLSAYVTQRGGDVIVPKSLGILCTLSNCDTINYSFGMTKPLYYPKNASDALNFTKNFMEKIGYAMDGTEWIDAVDFGSYMTVTIQQKVQGWIVPNQMIHFIFYRDNTTFSFGRWYGDITNYQFKIGQDDAKSIAKDFMQKETQTNPELKKFQYKMQEIGETRVIIFDDKPAYVIPVSFKSTLEQKFENVDCGYPEYFTRLVMIEGVTGAVLGLDLPGCE